MERRVSSWAADKAHDKGGGTCAGCSERYMRPCGAALSGGCVASRNQTGAAATAARLGSSQFNLAWPGDHGEAALSSRLYDGVVQVRPAAAL